MNSNISFYRTPDGKVFGPWGELSLNSDTWWMDVGCPIMKKGEEVNLPLMEEIGCLHLNCPSCNGTGTKSNGQMCVHMISCPCPRCSPSC